MNSSFKKFIKLFTKNNEEVLKNTELKKKWLTKNIDDDYQENIANREVLNKNSNELVKFIQKNGIINYVDSIHEIGCGCGRNLAYILNKFEKQIVFSGNDLSKESCFSHMDDNLSKRLNFIEEDTLKYLLSQVSNNKSVDLLLSSDHMMHLGRDIITDVYNYISKYSSKYILIREPYGERVTMTDGFLWASDRFENKFNGFDLIDYKISDSSTSHKEFRYMLFKKKK